MKLNEMILNTTEAADFIRGIEDEVTRNLLRVALFQVARRVMQERGVSEAEMAARLPSAPFDALFYVTVLARMFSQQSLLRGLLDGKTTEEASGWLIED